MLAQAYSGRMEGHQDSLWPLQHFLETWAAGARDQEIERLIATLKDELRRRGYDICRELRRGQR